MSSSPTFWTTMWMRRRSCWPRWVAVNGAPGPSAATANRDISIAAACTLGAWSPLRSMASLRTREGGVIEVRVGVRWMKFETAFSRVVTSWLGGEWARQWCVPGEDLVREIRGVVPRGRGGAVAR